MKKLLLLLILPFVVSCGSDDEEKYLDPAIIEGTWLWEDGLYLQYVIFENEKSREFAVNKYTGDRSEGRFYSSYKLTEDKIYRTRNGKESYIEYKLKNDSIIYMKKVYYKKVPPLTDK